MDKWQELTIEVNREVEEAASNILIESGSQGVAIDDSATLFPYTTLSDLISQSSFV